MKVTISFDMDSQAFESADEVRRILLQAATKIERQRARAPGCICTAPEADDKLIDAHGNTVGSVCFKGD